MQTLQKLKKTVKITDLLKVKSNKSEFFIVSPFRQEKTPSFKINQTKNIWFDFGSGEGGTVLDLIIKLKNCDVKEAVNFLKNYDANTSFSFSPAFQPVFSQTENKKIELKKVTNIENKALLAYLKSRKIDVDIASKYLKDVYFQIKSKNYFGLGFKNDKDGFEIRNKYIKMCLFDKSITTILKNSDNVAIFEGFMDFLSALTFYKKEPKDNVIVLNSLSLLQKLDLSKYKKISLFLDNDEAGKNATKMIMSKYNNVFDYSNIYKGFKDFNEFLFKK